MKLVKAIIKLLSIVIIALSITIFQTNAFAIDLIRDSETEKFLKQITNPILITAGLDPNFVKIYIVNDSSVNAFVSGGQNIFVNTGLILMFDKPDVVWGVLAHEIGHIASGHLARMKDGAESATGTILLSYLLGIGAIIGGAPDAGQAILVGGSQTATRLFMKYTRGQEEAADQLALQYLKKLNKSDDGLIEVLTFFNEQTRGIDQDIPEYIMSHPVSKKRIDYLKNNSYHSTPDPNYKNLKRDFDRISTKISAFLDDPDYTISKYSKSSSQNAKYATSIALFRKGDVESATKILDTIIKSNPRDGFLYELKGQMLLESGYIADSIKNYSKSISLLDKDDATLPRIYLASGILLLKNTDRSLVEFAISNLESARRMEPDNPAIFKQLAKAYHKIKDEGRENLALAEFYSLIGDEKKCIKFAQDAKKILSKEKDKNKSEILLAEDLIKASKEDLKKEKI